MSDFYTEERKHLIGLIAYVFSEVCAEKNIDGLLISNMVKITKIAESYEFPLNENGEIETSIVIDDLYDIAISLIDEI